MSKTITIPSDKGNPVVVVLNGKKYTYAAGATESVPDEVAALLESNSQEAVIYGRSAYAHLEAAGPLSGDDFINVYVDTQGNMKARKSDIQALNVFEPGTGDHSVVQKTKAGEENTASGEYAVAFGNENVASGNCSSAIGENATASGACSFAGGMKSVQASGTEASGKASMALGVSVTASGDASQAFGQRTVASANMSSAFGNYTKATGRVAFVIGQANVEDTNDVDTTHGTGARKYIFIIGNGSNDSNRSNALTVDWDGNLVASGSVTATNIPAPPSSDGTYSLKVTVASGVATYAWVADAT